MIPKNAINIEKVKCLLNNGGRTMRKSVLISTILFFGILSTDIVLARTPTKQPPFSLYKDGRVALSPDFMEYLIEVKDYGSSHEVFRTVQYNFPEIQRDARDFLREGTQKTQKIKQKKDEELRKKSEYERKLAEDKENQQMLGITGQDFLILFNEVEKNRYSYKGEKQQRYLSFLEKRLIKENEIYKMEESYSTFCCEPDFFQRKDERAISIVKRRLKKYGLLNQKEFLNNSAASIVQQILNQEFPCMKK